MKTCSNSPDHVDSSRRRSILGLGALAGAVTALPISGRAGAETTPIHQPARAGPAAFMARAREMRELASASGDQAYGAVVVRNGRIVGQAPSRVVTVRDPTAHAETEAIRDAARRLATRNLAGCVLYSTSRPCAMCETAAYWAGIDGLIHGESLSDAGVPRYGGC
jgi:guanine deaminase